MLLCVAFLHLWDLLGKQVFGPNTDLPVRLALSSWPSWNLHIGLPTRGRCLLTVVEHPPCWHPTGMSSAHCLHDLRVSTLTFQPEQLCPLHHLGSSMSAFQIEWLCSLSLSLPPTLGFSETTLSVTLETTTTALASHQPTVIQNSHLPPLASRSQSQKRLVRRDWIQTCVPGDPQLPQV